MTRDISCNQMMQITFIRMLDSDSTHLALHQSTEYNMVGQIKSFCGRNYGKYGFEVSAEHSLIDTVHW